MIRLPLIALLLATAAQAAPPSPEALRDAALDDTMAWDLVEGLTTEVGQRLAATEAEARARDWSVARLKALGFANVHIETFAMPVWRRKLRENALGLSPEIVASAFSSNDSVRCLRM